jgi:hypothetical protein
MLSRGDWITSADCRTRLFQNPPMQTHEVIIRFPMAHNDPGLLILCGVAIVSLLACLVILNHNQKKP